MSTFKGIIPAIVIIAAFSLVGCGKVEKDAKQEASTQTTRQKLRSSPKTTAPTGSSNIDPKKEDPKAEQKKEASKEESEKKDLTKNDEDDGEIEEILGVAAAGAIAKNGDESSEKTDDAEAVVKEDVEGDDSEKASDEKQSVEKKEALKKLEAVKAPKVEKAPEKMTSFILANKALEDIRGDEKTVSEKTLEEFNKIAEEDADLVAEAVILVANKDLSARYYEGLDATAELADLERVEAELDRMVDEFRGMNLEALTAEEVSAQLRKNSMIFTAKEYIEIRRDEIETSLFNDASDEEIIQKAEAVVEEDPKAIVESVSGDKEEDKDDEGLNRGNADSDKSDKDKGEAANLLDDK